MKSARSVPSLAVVRRTISLDQLAMLNGFTRPVSVTQLLHRLSTNPAPPGGVPQPGILFHPGVVWWLSLDNERTQQVVDGIDVVKAALEAATGPGWPMVKFVVETATGHIDAVNRLGGRNGVDINGVVNLKGVIITPRGDGIHSELIRVARFAVAGQTILEFVLSAAAELPAFAHALNIGTAADIYRLVASGTPLGWAIAVTFGALFNELLPTPDPDEYGLVHADRDAPLEHERFWMAQVAGDRVSLLSWVGLLSAQNGGGMGVYANRVKVGDWETWKLIRNSDRTVSFQTHNGHFLCAEEGGGRECQANRTSIGDWEKFHVVFQPDGKIALKTKAQGKFVRVLKEEED